MHRLLDELTQLAAAHADKIEVAGFALIAAGELALGNRGAATGNALKAINSLKQSLEAASS